MTRYICTNCGIQVHIDAMGPPETIDTLCNICLEMDDDIIEPTMEGRYPT